MDRICTRTRFLAPARPRSARAAALAVLLGLAAANALHLDVRAEPTGRILWADGDRERSCEGRLPCFATIQEAIDAAAPGDTIRILPGDYRESLVVKRKNRGPEAAEADRIVIEADPDRPPGGVVLRGVGECPRGFAVRIFKSSFVTLRGLTISGAGRRGVTVIGGGARNQGIVLERNRIDGDGDARCAGGITIGRGNAGTAILNNVVQGTERNGINFRGVRGGGHLVLNNTVIGNGWNGIELDRGHDVRLANNLVALNGVAARERGGRFGVRRASAARALPETALLKHNLICGNRGGELGGPLLDAADHDNQTPTGAEGPGVVASPGCELAAALFLGVPGTDGVPFSADDDLALAPGSPAIDRGVDTRTLAAGISADRLEADLLAEQARPRDGDDDGEAEFDVGALEGPGERGATPTATISPTPGRTATPTQTPTPSPTATPTPSPTPTPSGTPAPSPTGTPSPAPANRPPDIVSEPVTRVVVAVEVVEPPEPSFDYIELTPADVGSMQGDVFSTLPTQGPSVFGFTGADVRAVNFDTRPDASAIPSGTFLTDEYAGVGVLMSSIQVANGVYGGPASPPNATYIAGSQEEKSFTFTVPVIAVGIVNTSPDQDRIEFLSPTGEPLFSIRDQDDQPGPNFNVDRFVGARVTDANLIGSIVFANNTGQLELDEMVFEVSTAQLPRADYAYDVDAVDPDLDPLAYALLEKPAGMTIDPTSGLIAWTPTSLDVGVHHVKVRVEDGRGGADEQEYDLEVVEQPKVPNVIGLGESAAGDAIAAAGFTVGAVSHQHHPTPTGEVFGQDPLGGTRAPTGTAVDLVVSLGPAPTATPTITPTPTPTATPTLTPTATASVTVTVTVTATPDALVPTPTATATPPPVPCDACMPCDTGLPGVCAPGRSTCGSEFAEPVCVALALPSSESCGNALDEDCDGAIDEPGLPAELPTTPPKSGVFVEPLGTTVTFPNGGSTVGIARGDFNHDTQLDLAVTQDGTNPRSIAVLLGNGDGTFAAPLLIALPQSPTIVSPQALLAQDFDGDGTLDLLAAAYELRQVLFYHGLGNGTFADPVASDVTVRAAQIQVADVNCDAILDVAALGTDDDSMVTVALGHGDGTFGEPTSYAFNHAAVDLTLADVNGDVSPDLVVGTHNFAPVTGIGVRLNDGSGQFGALIHTPGQSVPDPFGNHGHNQVFGLQVADFDLDGEPDVVASTQGPVGCFVFMKGNGDGSFALPDLFDGVPSLDPSWSCVGGGNLQRRYSENVAPDVNADGKPDVLFTYGSDDNRVVVGLGRGDGTFDARVFAASAGTGVPGSPSHPRADGAGVAAAIVGDVNGDCMLDLVTAGFGTNASQGRMGVLLAREPGDFHAPRIAPLLRDPSGDNGHQAARGVTVGDFNEDGTPDFAAGVGRAFFTVPGAGIGIDVFAGDGTGRGTALPFTLNNYGGTGAQFLRSADFDGDETLDLVFMTGTAPFGAREAITTVFGAGDATFGDRQDARSPILDANLANLRNIIVANLDRDDDPDVAALVDDGGRKRVQTFRNDGTRTPLVFVGEADAGTPMFGTALAAGDFNEDGDPDLVTPNFERDTLVLLAGNGDLTVQPGVDIAILGGGSSRTVEEIAVADLNGDDHLDLAMGIFFHACGYVLLGHGDGTFDAPVCYPIWTGRTNRLAIADFDVDGALDLAVGVEDGGLYFLRGRGDGTFEDGQPYAIGRHTTEVVNVADFNRDGRPDLLWSFNNGQFGHSIVLSNLLGTAPTPTPTVTATATGVTPTPTPSLTRTPTPTITATPPLGLASLVVEPVGPIILAGDTQQFKATGIFDDGTSTDLTASVAWTSGTPGVASIAPGGLATGLAGGTSTIGAAIGMIQDSTTLTVGAQVPGDGTPPVVAILAPAEDATVTEPVDVVGTATDANFLRYELAIAPAGSTAFTPLAQGGSPVTAGVLGTLDPTVLLNDTYTLKLTAFDRGGNSAEVSIGVQISREQKVGLFSLTFTDLNVALVGLPITVVRSYDSRDKSVGDFGFGWQSLIDTVRVRTNRLQGTAWQVDQDGLTYQLSPTLPHKVSVLLPDGREELFDLTPQPSASFLIPLEAVQAVYTPRPGTRGTLQPLGNTSLIILDGQPGEVELLDDTTFNPYDPQTFQYTDAQGNVYVISRMAGLQTLQDRKGNQLTFGAGGITHSSGRGVTFVRDGVGRISTITDPEGNVLAYTYDANGDLRTYTDARGNVAHYTYDRFHNLLEILDPLGNRATRNAYDADGRLISTTDAQGHETTYTHDLDARVEEVRDRLGHLTVLEYDAEGNVLAKTDPLGHRTEYTYDADGNVLTETDPAGRVRTSTYDSRGNPLTSSDFEGNTTTRTFNAFGQILTSTDPDGRLTTNTYDGEGNVLTVTDPEGGITTNTYDGAGNQLTATDPLGHLTERTYDAFGSPLTTKDPLGIVTTFTNDDLGRPQTESRPRTLPGGGSENVAFAYAFDETATGGTVTAPLNAVGAVVADDAGREMSRTDPAGNQTAFERDELGRVVVKTFEDGSTEETAYDAEGRKISEKDRDGFTTLFAYDPLGRLLETTYPDATTETRTYDVAGRLATVTDERGHVTTYTYPAPNQQRVTDALGNETLHELDARGNVTRTTDALGHATEFAYDSLSRLVETTYPDGTTSSTDYDLGGRKIAETDQAGHTTQFGYDLLDRLTTVTDAAGAVTTYAYDELGNLTTQTDAEGHVTRYEYDARGRVTKHIKPLGAFATYAYDANGNVTSSTDFNGDTTTFTIDTNDRVTRKTFPGGAMVDFVWTPAGRRTGAGGDVATYDARGRMLQETKAGGDVITYTYDDAGNKTSVTDPLGTTTYTYDALDRLETATDATGVTTYAYDPVGNLATTTAPDGTTTTHTYDTLNRLAAITTTGPGGLVSSYTYTLDPAGKRTQVVEAGPATGGRTVGYTYGDVNRLIEEEIDAPGTADDQTITYTYDDVGNRLTRETVQGATTTTTTSTYDDEDRLLTESTLTMMAAGPRGDVRYVMAGYVSSPALALIAAVYVSLGLRGSRRRRRRAFWKNGLALVLVGATVLGPGVAYADLTTMFGPRSASAQGPPVETTYAYDDNGNLLSKDESGSSDTYAYDFENQLIAATLALGPTPGPASYVYDADGLRTSATAGGATRDYLWDKNREYAQVLTETAGASTVRYAFGHERLSLTRTGTGTRYYHHDGQLSTRYLTTAAGTVSDTYGFDAFGELLASSGATPNDFLYTGEQLDPNLGFYYLRARYYAQALGRFISSDPVAGSPFDPPSLHRYLYAHADPVNNHDPSGESDTSLASITVAIGIISVTAGIFAGIVVYRVTGSVGLAVLAGVIVTIVTFVVLNALVRGRLVTKAVPPRGIDVAHGNQLYNELFTFLRFKFNEGRLLQSFRTLEVVYNRLATRLLNISGPARQIILQKAREALGKKTFEFGEKEILEGIIKIVEAVV